MGMIASGGVRGYGKPITKTGESEVNIDVSRRLVIAQLIASLALTATASPGAYGASSSVAAIKSYYARLVSTMRAASGLSIKARYDRLAPMMASAFDFATMTRIAVGPAWSKASAAQQSQLRDAFARLMGAYYANRIDGYSGEQFSVDPATEQRGGQELVKTKLVKPSGGSTQINYLMRGSRIIDVYLNGTISEVASRRAEFAGILKSGGLDALLKALHDRSNKLLAG
jgi:phospholipid transport system substrate-binding protein